MFEKFQLTGSVCSKWQQSRTAFGWRSSRRRSFGALRCETPAVRKSCGQKPLLNNIVSATTFFKKDPFHSHKILSLTFRVVYHWLLNILGPLPLWVKIWIYHDRVKAAWSLIAIDHIRNISNGKKLTELVQLLFSHPVCCNSQKTWFIVWKKGVVTFLSTKCTVVKKFYRKYKLYDLPLQS